MRVKVELIAIELPQFGSAKSRSLDLEAGANVADALSGLGVDADPALLAMVNGEAVPRDRWPDTWPDDTISLFRLSRRRATMISLPAQRFPADGDEPDGVQGGF